MPWTREALIQLRTVLISFYPLRDDALRVLRDAQVNIGLVSLDSKPVNLWDSALRVAENGGRLADVIKVALEENPGHEGLKKALDGVPPPLMEAPDIGGFEWKGAPARPGQLEQIIGDQSTLVPVSFLEQGMRVARSVARLQRADGAYGTGFLIGKGLLLTNHHVLNSPDAARSTEAHFNFQQTVDGLAAPMKSYALRPDECFETSKQYDWSVVRIEDGAEAEWGYLPLEEAPIKKGDRVNIIQHPSGGPKQLSFFHNQVVYADANRVQYLTDTLPGSSGSPVLDAQWRVVALHHSGGQLMEPGTKLTFFRNQGTPIGVIVKALGERGLLS
jgi:S1-C subfamily serine protease